MIDPATLADPDCLPFPYDHVITAGDLYRVLNELVRPILNAVSSQIATITTTSPLTINVGGTVHPAVAVPGLNPARGGQVLVLLAPASGTYYAVTNIA